jgi:hypothetical protein
MRNSHPDVVVGSVFGRLTALREIHGKVRDQIRLWWQVRCECGAVLDVPRIRLQNGTKRSCGCLARNHIIIVGKKNRTHGAKGTGEYTSWADMMQRCTNTKREKYPRYGGRGIKVCERWRSSFEDFLSDMGAKPDRDHSIECIDNDGNYEPGNCRWASPKEQARNQSTSVFV